MLDVLILKCCGDYIYIKCDHFIIEIFLLKMQKVSCIAHVVLADSKRSVHNVS